MLLPPQGEGSSHSAPAPVWGPSHGRQFSTNFSNVSPSHRLQFFTNCPSVGPPWGHKPCQQTCSSVGSSLHGSAGPGRSLLQHEAPHGGHSLLQASTCSGVGSLPWSTGGYLLHGPPWTAGGQPASPLSFITSCKGRVSAPELLQCCCRVVSLTSSHSSLLTSISLQFFFFSFLNMLSQRHYHCR